jgi:hypothetical protein
MNIAARRELSQFLGTPLTHGEWRSHGVKLHYVVVAPQLSRNVTTHKPFHGDVCWFNLEDIVG